MPKLTWGEGVRLPQAVADLAFQIKALLPASLGDIAAASGQSLAETGASFRILRDDQYRFQAVQTQPLYQGLVQIALAQRSGFQVCAVILLADLVQRDSADPALAGLWPRLQARLQDQPAVLRAALANGLRQAVAAGLIALPEPLLPALCLTRGPKEITPALLRVARAMRHHEIYAVCAAGPDLQASHAALIASITEQDGILRPQARGVVWQAARQPDALGFAGCTALLALNALQGAVPPADFAGLWADFAAEMLALPPSKRDPICAALRLLHEQEAGFAPASGSFALPVVEELD